MLRNIVAFEQDDADHWVAILECEHRQHVRHRPLLENREWVLTAGGRNEHLGTSLNCIICDEVSRSAANQVTDKSAT